MASTPPSKIPVLKNGKRGKVRQQLDRTSSSLSSKLSLTSDIIARRSSTPVVNVASENLYTTLRPEVSITNPGTIVRERLTSSNDPEKANRKSINKPFVTKTPKATVLLPKQENEVGYNSCRDALTFRVSNIPFGISGEKFMTELANVFGISPTSDTYNSEIILRSIAPSTSDAATEQVAVVTFNPVPTRLYVNKHQDVPIRMVIGSCSFTANLDSHFIGLTPLNDVLSGVCDLVFVTGLAGHAYGSWKASGTTTMWIQDFLIPDVQQYNFRFRVLTYGFDSRLQQSTSSASISDFAKGLLNSLCIARQSNRGQPSHIIFVGHSLGGLLIKEVLRRTATSCNPTEQDIFQSTTAAIFMGVPHRGLETAALESMVRDQENAFLIESLRPNSQYLDLLDATFRDLFEKNNFRTISIYETKLSSTVEKTPDTGEWKKTGDLVKMVERGSAMPSGPIEKTSDQLSRDTDHSGLSKFQNRSDPDYKILRQRIMECTKVSIPCIRQTSENIVTTSQNSTAPRYFNVPFLRNDNYVWRTEISKQFISSLQKKRDGEQIRIAIHGLGGSGKTQFVLDFVYNNKQIYDVFWIRGATIESFLTDFSAIGQERFLPNIKDLKQEELCRATKAWLNSNELNWLLVIDNADELTSDYIRKVNAYLPLHKGTILFTTRDKNNMGKLVKPQFCLTIQETMTTLEAIETFTSICELPDLQTESVANLIGSLGCLPLAVVQAASYILQNSITIGDYMKRLNSSEVRLLNIPIKELNSSDDLPRAVMTTWDVSYQLIEKTNSSAARLLEIMSLLDFQSIPKSFLYSRHSIFEDEIDFDQAISVLLSFSLVSKSISSLNEGSTYRMHRLVSLWTRHNIKNPIETREKVSNIILLEFPEPDETNTLRCQDLIPHVQSMISFCQQPSLKEVSSSLRCIYAKSLHHVGSYELAEANFRECLSYYELDTSKDNTLRISDCIQYLGLVFLRQGQHQDALDWFARALAGKEKLLGKDHFWTLGTVNNIAAVYYSQGEYIKALEWYTRALVGYERSLGKDHPSTLKTINNIAMIYDIQEQYNEALEWFTRSLSGKERLLGKNHLSTLDTVFGIAVVYHKQGRYEEAIDWYMWALVGKEKLLGKNHLSTYIIVNNIAIVFTSLGQYETALEWYTRALTGKKKLYGMEHLSTLETVYNIAKLYHDQRRFEEAINWYTQALVGREKSLSKNHPSILGVYYNMGVCYECQCAYNESLRCFRRAMVGYLEAFDPEYEWAIKSKEKVYRIQGLLDKQQDITQPITAKTESGHEMNDSYNGESRQIGIVDRQND